MEPIFLLVAVALGLAAGLFLGSRLGRSRGDSGVAKVAAGSWSATRVEKTVRGSSSTVSESGAGAEVGALSTASAEPRVKGRTKTRRGVNMRAHSGEWLTQINARLNALFGNSASTRKKVQVARIGASPRSRSHRSSRSGATRRCGAAPVSCRVRNKARGDG